MLSPLSQVKQGYLLKHSLPAKGKVYLLNKNCLELILYRAEIEKLCDEIDTMAAGLAALQARGEVTDWNIIIIFLFIPCRVQVQRQRHWQQQLVRSLMFWRSHSKHQLQPM